ncbi:MAG: ABC transporter permease subunit [Saprospiraceae bacterium]|nr:ABC transporter permease subunit [Saprospiraceae bacterium]
MIPDWLFKLRGELTGRQSIILAIGGLIFLLLVWILLTTGENPILSRTAFPHPLRVVGAFRDLYIDNELFKNIFRSVGLNLGGYIKAIAYAIPIGFLIGLVPLFRGAFQKVVDAIRFLPLTALTVMFILWFGIYADAKINFLAFGIFIYLVPIVVQRIDEVDDVYLKTVYTLGAGYWQTIRTVYLPSVLSRLSDDIRILTAISWTYIIVAETSADQGGIGSLIYRTGQRMGRADKTIACLIIIMLIGVFQDRIFAYLDRKFFPHKYQLKTGFTEAKALKNISIIDNIFDYIVVLTTWLFILLYILFAINEVFPFIGDVKPLSYLFGDTLWTVHVLFVLILIYQFRNLYRKIVKT